MNKKYNIGELILLIFACAIAFVLCANALGIIIYKIPTSPQNIELRLKLVDLLEVISGGVIGAVSTMLARKDKTDKIE